MAFQISSVKTRYFEFEDPESGKILHIEPPKLKVLNKLEKINENNTPEDLSAVIAQIISKNKEERTVTADDIMEWMDGDQLAAFIREFLGWLNRTKQNDPN